MSDQKQEPKPVSTAAATQKTATNQSAGQAMIGVVLLGAAVWFFLGGGVEDRIAKDAEAQYEIVSRSGTAIERCAYAGLVSAAYLQAKNEAKYQEWKSLEASVCRAAGVPR